jgi:hypothetical protein
VGVEPDGVKLTFAGYGSGHASTLSAGQAASILPPDVLADISFGDAPSLLRSWVQEAEAGGIWDAATRREVDRAVSDITSHMKGEADVVLFRSPRAMHFGSPSSYNAPLTLMWPVSGDAAALQGLDNAVTSLHEGKEFTRLTTPDGTVARQATGTQGGYAVRHGWAVLSLDIGPTIDSLSHVSGQTLATAPGYRAALPAGGKAASVWYVNTDDLRQDLETAILPTEPRAMVSSYRQEALPILAPFRAIAGSASGSTGPNITVSTFNVRITATP